MATFEILKSGENFHFNLKANNGEVILSSESYTTIFNCRNGVESVRVNSNSPAQYEVKKASDGAHYFVLKATNGQVIGQSEMYQSLAACENGMKSVMNNAPSAVVKEA